MTPKEKANELFNKIYRLNHRDWYDVAKQCAFIAIDELILNGTHLEMYYWQEVKREIEKL